MLGLDSDDGAGGGADSRSIVGESGSAMVRLSVFTVFGCLRVPAAIAVLEISVAQVFQEDLTRTAYLPF